MMQWSRAYTTYILLAVFAGCLLPAFGIQVSLLSNFTQQLSWQQLQSQPLFVYNSVAAMGVFAWVWLLYQSQIKEKRRAVPLKAEQTVNDTAASEDVSHDVLIIGAGVAGGALAAFLGKHGKRVLLIERDLEEPHRIVGELLQPGGVAKLRAMGLESVLEGIDAQEVEGYGLLMKDKTFSINYPEAIEPKTNEMTAQKGRSFHNGRLITNLRNAAKSCSSVELKQGTVLKLMQSNGRITGVVYRQADGAEVRARAHLTVVSDGCFSAFRNSFSTAEFEVKSHFLGVILKDCPCPYANKGTVVLADPTPILCYPISSNEVRILVDFPENIPSASSGALFTYLLEKVMPQLPSTLQPAFKEAVEAKRLKTHPNRIMPARPFLVPGAVLLGDSLNMRHPLTGGGMTVAFTDVENLGNRLLKIDDFSKQPIMGNAVQEFYDTRRTPASAINILSVALYEVFSQKNDDLRDACFKYLQNGGSWARGPISLLSGLSRNQSELMMHFFAVAFYGCGIHLLPIPTPSRLLRAFRMIRKAVEIIRPLILEENESLAAFIMCTLFRILFFV